MTNYDNLAVFGQGEGTRSASYFRFDGTNSSKTTIYTYGLTEGYTMPLENAIYRLTAQVGGWGQVSKDVTVQIVNSSDEVVGEQTVQTPTTGVNDGGGVVDVNFVFNTSAAGNYKLQVKNGSTDADNAIVMSNIELKKAPANYTANLKVKEGKLGTFIAPFAVTLPANVKAYSATSDDKTVTLAKIADGGETLAAGTPVIVYNDEEYDEPADVDETFYGVPTVDENQTEGALVGILDENEKTVPVGAYVLQTQNTEQAFYIVDTAAPGSLNRCYVVAGASGEARLVISMDDAMIINAIEAAEAEAEGLKDGKYFIEGKIVIVKNAVKYSANGQILK
jgi:hypothetical protein